MHKVEINGRAYNSRVARLGCTHQIRCQHELGILVEIGSQTFFRQFHAIALHPWETDFQRITVRPHCLDMHGLTRFLRWRDHRFSREIKGDAQHVGVFNVE